MINWKHIDAATHLEAIETIAGYEGLIASETELSERFDSEIAPLVIAQYGEDDQPAINEAFNNWTDSLCKDGEIHTEHYNDYVYIGEYSDD